MAAFATSSNSVWPLAAAATTHLCSDVPNCGASFESYEPVLPSQAPHPISLPFDLPSLCPSYSRHGKRRRLLETQRRHFADLLDFLPTEENWVLLSLWSCAARGPICGGAGCFGISATSRALPPQRVHRRWRFVWLHCIVAC